VREESLRRSQPLGDDYEVLDPNPELARHVDTGFERSCVAVDEVGRFVNHKADAVAGPMGKRVPVASLFDHLPGDAIDGSGFDARHDRLDAGLLGVSNCVICPLELLGGSPSKTTVRVWSLGYPSIRVPKSRTTGSPASITRSP
jgi:hypothetical protein